MYIDMYSAATLVIRGLAESPRTHPPTAGNLNYIFAAILGIHVCTFVPTYSVFAPRFKLN